MNAAHPLGRSFAGDRRQYRIALRALYREVSKRIHPDLTRDELDRRRRESLMRQANEAYEDGDSHRLRRILREYEIGLESPRESRAAADLVAVVRGLTRKVRLQLTLLERFHNDRMKRHRSLLAWHLLAALPSGEMPEEVLDFFDEMHLFLRHGYLEEKVLWSTFGFSAGRWWAASRDGVLAERRRRNATALFGGFQSLASRFSEWDAREGWEEPTRAELTVFLEGERRLSSPLP
jgi:hypothetical protein